MRFSPPNLDNRKFQDIVDELKTRIPVYCPEWTDHNVSDPGVTMIELFAYLAEQLLFRMNQVPELHYLRFAQFLGVPLPAPQPAYVPVTFWLAKPLLQENGDPQEEHLLIPAGVQVSTTQTETIPPRLFTIQQGRQIRKPKLVSVIKRPSDAGPQAWPLDALFEGRVQGFEFFTQQPRPDDTVAFYFDRDMSNHVLQFSFELEDRRGTDIRTEQPPFVWEAYTKNNRWEVIESFDLTRGLNESGPVRLFLPGMARVPDSHPVTLRYGLRVRVTREEFRQTPFLLRISQIAALGITLNAAFQDEALDEVLGISDGAPGQRFALEHGPVILPLDAKAEWLEVALPGPDNGPPKEAEEWRYVPSFTWLEAKQNGSEETLPKHFTIDPFTNELCLPPAIRRSNGEIKLYGAIPDRGKQLKLKRYRYGANVLEVAAGQINRLKTSIPYVDRVENRYAAIGGQAELPSVDLLRVQVQRYLRTGNGSRFRHAVTEEEYANLVLDEFPEEIGKVECRLEQVARRGTATGNRPAAPLEVLTVYVTAKAPLADILWGERAPEVQPQVIAEIDKLLHNHRMLTSRVRASNPLFVPVEVTVEINGTRDAAIETQVQHATARFLNPVYGAEDGTGWALDELCSGERLLLHLKQALVYEDLPFQKARIEPNKYMAVIVPDTADDYDALVAALNKKLGNAPVLMNLKQKMRSRMQPLTGTLDITELHAEESWLVRDQQQHVYRIQAKDDCFWVTDVQSDPPEARLFILSSFRLVFK